MIRGRVLVVDRFHQYAILWGDNARIVSQLIPSARIRYSQGLPPWIVLNWSPTLSRRLANVTGLNIATLHTQG